MIKITESTFFELGLNKYESNAYQAAITHGKATASKISAQSGVPHSRIYDVMESLQHKGLVKILPGKTKEYTATDPENLLKIIKEKKEKIETTEKKIIELKKIYEEKEKEPVLIATGRNNFHALMKEIPSAKKYNYAIRYLVDTRPEFIKKTINHIDRELDERSIFRVNKETEKNVKKFIKQTKVPSKKLENEGVILSLNDRAVLIGLIKSNTTILIKDEAFIKFMKKAYECVWDASEPINF